MRAFLLLFPFFIHAKVLLSICSMFQNEGPWLVEWIEYHRVIGVQHFYLYDNDSSDESLKILEPYIQKGMVEVIPWPSTPEHWDPRGIDFNGYQIKAFNDCVARALNQTQWLAVIDVDEFIVPINGKSSLFRLLNNPQLENVGSIWLYWRMFGTSNVWEIPKDKLMIETLTMRGDETLEESQFFKSIHRPEAIADCHVHCAQLKPEYQWMVCKANAYRINHYYTRAEKDCWAKRFQGRVEGTPDYDELRATDLRRIVDLVLQLNEVEDRSILQYVEEVRKKMRRPR